MFFFALLQKPLTQTFSSKRFERELRNLRADRKCLACAPPIARATEAELAEHFLSLSPRERLELVCGMMKDAVCRAVHFRVGSGEGSESLETPVLMRGGLYLEPPRQPWVAKRLETLLSQSRRAKQQHDPTLLCMLAALTELMDEAVIRVAHLRDTELSVFIRSLFMVRLVDLDTQCSMLALNAGPQLEGMCCAWSVLHQPTIADSFSRAAARALAGQIEGGPDIFAHDAASSSSRSVCSWFAVLLFVLFAHTSFHAFHRPPSPLRRCLCSCTYVFSCLPLTCFQQGRQQEQQEEGQEEAQQEGRASQEPRCQQSARSTPTSQGRGRCCCCCAPRAVARSSTGQVIRDFPVV